MMQSLHEMRELVSDRKNQDGTLRYPPITITQFEGGRIPQEGGYVDIKAYKIPAKTRDDVDLVGSSPLLQVGVFTRFTNVLNLSSSAKLNGDPLTVDSFNKLRQALRASPKLALDGRFRLKTMSVGFALDGREDTIGLSIGMAATIMSTVEVAVQRIFKEIAQREPIDVINYVGAQEQHGKISTYNFYARAFLDKLKSELGVDFENFDYIGSHNGIFLASHHYAIIRTDLLDQLLVLANVSVEERINTFSESSKMMESGESVVPFQLEDSPGKKGYLFEVPLTNEKDIKQMGNMNHVPIKVKCWNAQENDRGGEWTISFIIDNKEFEENGVEFLMQRWEDPMVSRLIVGTVRACVIDFINKYKNKIESVAFAAVEEFGERVRGREKLYESFIKTIGKTLGFIPLAKEFSGGVVYVALSPGLHKKLLKRKGRREHQRSLDMFFKEMQLRLVRAKIGKINSKG